MNNRPLIQLDSIAQSFTSGQDTIEVLREVNFELNTGESTAILGASGTGKTSMLNILTLLERPQSGEVYWSGEVVTQLSNTALAQKRSRFMGLVFQGVFLIPELTVLDNVLIPMRIQGKYDEQAIKQARLWLDKVGLQGREDALTRELSGGESQRVAIARALVHQPPVVITDEPTGNLDEDNGMQIMQLLLELCESSGTSLIMVTHNRQHAEMLNTVYRLSQGSLAHQSKIAIHATPA